MKPSKYLIGILIFSLIITSGVFLIGLLHNENPDFVDSERYTDFNRTFNKLDDATSTVDSMESGIENADTDFGAFGVLNSLISTGWNSLKLMLTSLSFMHGVFNGLYTFFGVPPWVGSSIIALTTLVIIFAIFSAIFQRDV